MNLEFNKPSQQLFAFDNGQYDKKVEVTSLEQLKELFDGSVGFYEIEVHHLENWGPWVDVEFAENEKPMCCGG